MIPRHRVTELANCTIWGFSWLLPLGTTACPVKLCTQKKNKFTMFISHSTELKSQTLLLWHLIPIQSQTKDSCGHWLVSHFQPSLLGVFLCIWMRLRCICRATCFGLMKSAHHNVNISVIICQLGELRWHYIFSLIPSNFSKWCLCKPRANLLLKKNQGLYTVN